MIIEHEYCASFIYDNCKNLGRFYGTREECVSFLSDMGYNIGSRDSAGKVVKQNNGEPMLLKAIVSLVRASDEKATGKLGLATKQYPNHGTVLVPCDSQGNALGDNVISMEVKDGIVTVQYHAAESMKFGGAKGMSSGHYRFSAMSDDSKGQDMTNAEMSVKFDASELKQVLDDFIQVDLPNVVREIAQDEMHKQIKAAAMSRAQ